MGTQFLFCKIKKTLKTGCTTTWMYLTLQNCTLELVKMYTLYYLTTISKNVHAYTCKKAKQNINTPRTLKQSPSLLRIWEAYNYIFGLLSFTIKIFLKCLKHSVKNQAHPLTCQTLPFSWFWNKKPKSSLMPHVQSLQSPFVWPANLFGLFHHHHYSVMLSPTASPWFILADS